MRVRFLLCKLSDPHQVQTMDSCNGLKTRSLQSFDQWPFTPRHASIALCINTNDTNDDMSEWHAHQVLNRKRATSAHTPRHSSKEQLIMKCLSRSISIFLTDEVPARCSCRNETMQEFCGISRRRPMTTRNASHITVVG